MSFSCVWFLDKTNKDEKGIFLENISKRQQNKKQPQVFN